MSTGNERERPSAAGREPARRYETEIEIAASADAVWQAIASDAELRRWFPVEAHVEPGVGGEVRWCWGDEVEWKQTVDVWQPGARLLTRYDSGVDDGEGGTVPLFVDFRIEARGGRTTLRLVHSGFGPDASFDQEYDGIRRGWPVELQSLRLYLERHAGTDRSLAWCARPIAVSHAEAWSRLCGPDGLACGEGVDGLAPGAPYRIVTAAGDAFEGTALTCAPREFSGVAATHADGFLRFSVESCGGQDMVWLWLATWGEPPERTAAQRERWEAMLDRLFATADDRAGAV